jgi:signal transduction histidine kinase
MAARGGRVLEGRSMSAVSDIDDPRLLARLLEVGATLNSTLEPDAILRFILTAATELLDCETASILVYNPKRGDLSFHAATDPDADRLAEIPVPLDGSLAGWIFRTGEPLCIDDVANDPRHYVGVAKQTGFQPRSFLGVPMVRAGQATGVLEALNKRNGCFTTMDQRVLAIIASQAAVAVFNAQLVGDLRRADAELRRVDRVKSDFMAMASHELRTPLAIIMNYAEFLLQDTTGTLSRHAGRCLDAAKRQRAIIDSMTNMNLLQLGAIDLKLAPVALTRVVAEVWNEMRADAEAKLQVLDIELPPEPVRVSADAQRLPLVFRHVLHNAIRFTPRGGSIVLRVEATATETLVHIRDTGVGIPSGELTNVFRDFYQVEDHMTRRHGGLGLGLAIARGIVHLHGGRIWAESPGPNQGTTIHVALPLLV